VSEWPHALMAALVAIATVLIGLVAFAAIVGGAVFLVWLFGQSV
jgi:hypothetical protein